MSAPSGTARTRAVVCGLAAAFLPVAFLAPPALSEPTLSQQVQQMTATSAGSHDHPVISGSPVAHTRDRVSTSLPAVTTPVAEGVPGTRTRRASVARKVRAVIIKADSRIDGRTRRLAGDLRSVKRAEPEDKTLPPRTASHLRALVQELQRLDRRVDAVRAKTPAQRAARKLAAAALRDYIEGAKAARVVASSATDPRKKRAAATGHKALVTAARSARRADRYLGCTLPRCGGLFGLPARAGWNLAGARHRAVSLRMPALARTGCENCEAKRAQATLEYANFIDEECLEDLQMGVGPPGDTGPSIESVFCMFRAHKRRQAALEEIDNNCVDPVQYQFTELGPIRVAEADGSWGLYWFRGRISAPGSLYERPWLLERRSHWEYPPSYERPPMDFPYEPFTMVLHRGAATRIYWGGTVDADLMIIEAADGDPNGMWMMVKATGAWSTGLAQVPITCLS